MENSPSGETGPARDIAPTKVGWSGRNTEDGSKVVRAMAEQAESGINRQQVEEVRTTLNDKSVAAALQMVIDLGWIAAKKPAPRKNRTASAPYPGGLSEGHLRRRATCGHRHRTRNRPVHIDEYSRECLAPTPPVNGPLKTGQSHGKTGGRTRRTWSHSQRQRQRMRRPHPARWLAKRHIKTLYIEPASPLAERARGELPRIAARRMPGSGTHAQRGRGPRPHRGLSTLLQRGAAPWRHRLPHPSAGVHRGPDSRHQGDKPPTPGA